MGYVKVYKNMDRFLFISFDSSVIIRIFFFSSFNSSFYLLNFYIILSS